MYAYTRPGSSSVGWCLSVPSAKCFFVEQTTVLVFLFFFFLDLPKNLPIITEYDVDLCRDMLYFTGLYLYFLLLLFLIKPKLHQKADTLVLRMFYRAVQNRQISVLF